MSSLMIANNSTLRAMPHPIVPPRSVVRQSKIDQFSRALRAPLPVHRLALVVPRAQFDAAKSVPSVYANRPGLSKAFEYLGLTPETENQGELIIPSLAKNETEVQATKNAILEQNFTLRMPLFENAVTSSADWKAFAGTWDRLALDKYMGDGGKYRERRYATLQWRSDKEGVELMPYGPMFQAATYNTLNGGKERWFEPVERDMLTSDTFKLCLEKTLHVFNALEDHYGRPHKNWFIEVDQFRILSRKGMAGNPTPEGIHTDGTDYFMVLMVNRHNVVGGKSTVYTPERVALASATLIQPSDAVLVDDNRTMHGVTPVQLSEGAEAGHRDVMVLSFTNKHKPGSIERRFGV